MRAALRFTPVYDPRAFEVPGVARALTVQRGALEKINQHEPTPVVIDHDMDRQVGTVREIYIAPTVDGGIVRDWFFASCDLTDPPGWLKRDGGVSWAYKALQVQDVKGTKRLLRALLTEISILSPSTAPGEKLARVSWVGEASSLASSTTSDPGVDGEVIHHQPGERLIRYFETEIKLR